MAPIELYTVVDVTDGKANTASVQLGSTWKSRKIHTFDNEAAAKSRRTALTNRYKGTRQFAVLLTVIRRHGAAVSEWVTDVKFDVPAG